MQNWNPDGPNAVTVPEGVVQVKVAAVCAFLRRKAFGIPSGFDEKMVEPAAVADVVPGEVTIAGDVIPIPERLRIVGVRVLGRGTEKEPTVFETGPGKRQRRDIDPESVDADEAGLEVRNVRRWNVLAEFEYAPGRAAADEFFKTEKAARVAAFLESQEG